MARYSATGDAGAASTSAATAGLLKIDNPSSTTMAPSAIDQIKFGPKANSADETYNIQAKRQSTAGTWTSVTPRPAEEKTGAAITLAGRASTAAGTAGVVLGTWGFHMRQGCDWFAMTAAAALRLPLVFSNGIIFEYVFAQGSAVLNGTLFFDE